VCFTGYDENRRARELLNDIQSMRIQADYSDWMGERTTSTMLLLSHYSPTNHHIKVSTSTRDAKVNTAVIVVSFMITVFIMLHFVDTPRMERSNRRVDKIV